MLVDHDLYQEVILEHSKRPIGKENLSKFINKVRGYNPLCGDDVTVAIKIEGDIIADIAFEGAGCAICMASTSIMVSTLKSRPVDWAIEVFNWLMTSLNEDNNDLTAPDPELSALVGVKKYPMRVKCATLAWHALMELLEGRDSKEVCTER